MSIYSSIELSRKQAIDLLISEYVDRLRAELERDYATLDIKTLEELVDEQLEPRLLNCVIVEGDISCTSEKRDVCG